MKKQAWMGDAIATTVGWVNPKTNEILVAAKGLEGAVEFDPRGNYKVKPVAKSTAAVKQAEPEVEAAEPEVSEVIPVPELDETAKEAAPKKKNQK